MKSVTVASIKRGMKGSKAYMGDNGFLITTEWGDQINVMIYQFADKDNGGIL